MAVIPTCRIFWDPSLHHVLSRILFYCLEDYLALSQVCRNVRYLLRTDPIIRDRIFHLMYSIPSLAPSLDGPIPSDPNDPRTPHDTEAFLREQALQRFSPSLVRCVHAKGRVAAVRDGYMVTLSCKPGRIYPHGWTVWALPLWHEVRRTTVTKRDVMTPVRADPIDPDDVPLPPRPSEAHKDQNMWMWEYALGRHVFEVAIQPQENLIAVAMSPAIVKYAIGEDKDDRQRFRLARRHRVYFYQLRPPGLAMSDSVEKGRPIPHPAAARPFVDFLQPIWEDSINDFIHYSLKTGPGGLVGLLVKPKAKPSGLLCVYDWRHGDLVGVNHMTAESGRFLDFDFITSRQVIALEVTPGPHSEDATRHTNLPVVPERCHLTVMQLTSVIPRSQDIVYHLYTTFQYFAAPHCWTLDDVIKDNMTYAVSLELPPLLHNLPAFGEGDICTTSLFGSLDIYPPISEDMPTSQVTFTVGFRAHLNGVCLPRNKVLRGAIAAGFFATLIPLPVMKKVLSTALFKWQRFLEESPNASFRIDDELRLNLEIVATQLAEGVTGGEANDHLHVSSDGVYHFTRGSTLFRRLVAAADAANVMKVIGGSIRSPQPATLHEALGGERGLEEHGRTFAGLLPPLGTTRKNMPSTPFRLWCFVADIELLPYSLSFHSSSYADRVVYVDTTYADDEDRDEDPDFVEGSFTLVMRNYSVALGLFGPQNVMDAARWYWVTGNGDKAIGRTYQLVPDTRSARYVKCSAPAVHSEAPGRVHTSWVDDKIFGTFQVLPRQLECELLADRFENETAYTETRVTVACASEGLDGMWFDGQTIVLAHGHAATLLCF